MAAEDGKRVEGSIPQSAAPGGACCCCAAARRARPHHPWNWPYTMPAEVLAPALACGNTVVWTPAPSTAVCSGLLAECVAEADLPPGVFNFVLGPGPEVGDELAVNPGTHAVAFTGSTETGLIVSRQAAGKAQLLEMGGNGPLVVHARRGPRGGGRGRTRGRVPRRRDRAAPRPSASWSTRPFGTSSCRCSQARSSERCAWAIRSTTATTMGPGEQRARCRQDGCARGRRRRARGDGRDRGSRAEGFPTALYWQPTVLNDVPRRLDRASRRRPSARSRQSSAIGSLEEAIEQTNAQTYGLMAAVFTADLAAGHALRRLGAHGPREHQRDDQLLGTAPAVGRPRASQSGIGRVGGRYPMDALTELQTVLIQGLISGLARAARA